MSVRHWKAARARRRRGGTHRARGLFYLATNNMCMDYQATRATRIAGTPFIGANTPLPRWSRGQLGAFIAWDAGAGKKVWQTTERYPVWSGALVTAGDVAFYGTLDGLVQGGGREDRQGPVAVSRSDREWWATRLPTRDRTAKQYVAVYAGIGGDWFLLAGDVRSDDPAMCGRRRTSCRTSPGTPAREASCGSSPCSRPAARDRGVPRTRSARPSGAARLEARVLAGGVAPPAAAPQADKNPFRGDRQSARRASGRSA